MKTSVRLIAAGIALLMVVSTATAQNREGQGRGRGGQGGGRGGFGGFGGDNTSMLLRNEKVQKELELSKDQVDQLTKLAEETREAMADLRDQDLDREKRTEKATELTKKGTAKINEVLLPHQQDRLKELRIQLAGNRALLQADVAEKLNLTSEQKEKLGELMPAFGGFGAGGGRGRGEGRGAGEGRGEGRGGEGRGEARGERPSEEERAKRTEERNKQVMDVLTSEQKDQYEKMKGKKTDITMQDLFQGFGGRGGEGRGRGEGRGGEGRGRGEGRGEGEGRGAGEGRAPRDA
jgi:Spy/CpxP family protein refolding chaperone